MERREYRTPRGQFIFIAIVSAVSVPMYLGLMIVSLLAFHGGGIVAGVLASVILEGVTVAAIVQLLEERVLFVTEDGIHGFRSFHRMDIPWSSVRSVEVDYLKGRGQHPAVWLRLHNGDRFPLPTTQGSAERAARIAEELNEDLREHADGSRTAVTSLT